jgi:uncharacterized Ntn-hydrolase superfamily protein
MNKLTFLFILLGSTLSVQSQDTFSIVAVDSATGEVGSAGASCVDLDRFNLPNDDFIGVLIPDVGAINTQAYYLQGNQTNATTRMNAGDSPSEIINWLTANDVQSRSDLRQYGIATLVNGSPQAAAFTGSSTDDYKNHIVGPNYAIQGNILLNQQVLDSMESRFLNEPGDLASKLMAALQGANVVGADTRCSSNGTSSLFAYVKVAQPTDSFGSPSFLVSVRTSQNARIEPIDSLQTKFNLLKSGGTTGLIETKDFSTLFTVYPNPVSSWLTVNNHTKTEYQIQLINLFGKVVHQTTLQNMATIATETFKPGIYFIKLSNEKHSFIQKVMVE